MFERIVMFKFVISTAIIFCNIVMNVSANEVNTVEAETEVTTTASIDIALTIIQAKCQHCHGLNGEASSAIYPRLAAQNKTYLKKQLEDFRSTKRKEPTMNEMAANLTDNEITALASYFSAQANLSHRVRNKLLSSVGEYIFKNGNEYTGIADCASCHGENGGGNELRPRLAGQHKRYVAEQLHRFTERARTNDNAIMFSIASKLTELEIEAVAYYVSGMK